jgi:uncharacterized protein YycO
MQTINTTTNPIVNIPQAWADLDGSIYDNVELTQELTDLINKQIYFSDLNNVTKALDLVVGDDGEIYVGGLPTAEGTWKIAKDGDNLIFQRFDGGSWITKDTIIGGGA